MEIKRYYDNGKPYSWLSSWRNMKERCFNSKSAAYRWYGARGINICKEWKNDADAFGRWSLDNGWQEGLTIDRINNDGHYEPKNCRWVERGVNSSLRARKNGAKPKHPKAIELRREEDIRIAAEYEAEKVSARKSIARAVHEPIVFLDPLSDYDQVKKFFDLIYDAIYAVESLGFAERDLMKLDKIKESYSIFNKRFYEHERWFNRW